MYIFKLNTLFVRLWCSIILSRVVLVYQPEVLCAVQCKFQIAVLPILFPSSDKTLFITKSTPCIGTVVSGVKKTRTVSFAIS